MTQLEPQPSPPEQPSVKVGRFEMFGAIASGGFASIHLGRTVGAGGFAKMVAIKRLHTQFAEDAEITKMFLDEARVVARIQHPNVVPTIDFIAQKGELFMVMEYIDGVTLAHLLQELDGRGHRMPLDVTLRIMSGALHGLHAAHEARDERGAPLCVIHRDVSPDNILIGVDGYPRILDFGVAKALGSYHATRDGMVKGKMSYLTPEQVMGKPVSRRTDVFSASVVLWQCLAGRQLFAGDHMMELAVKVMQAPIVPPSTYNPGIPPRCDQVVMRGLERDPEQRWQTAELMAEAIEEAGKLATPARVGKWVKTIVPERLARRAARVSAVELTPTGHEGAAALPADAADGPAGPERSGQRALRAGKPPDAPDGAAEPRRRGMAADDDEATSLFSKGERDFKAVTMQVMAPRPALPGSHEASAEHAARAHWAEGGLPSEPGDVPTRVKIAPAVAAAPPAAAGLPPVPMVAVDAPAPAATPAAPAGSPPLPSRPSHNTVPMNAGLSAVESAPLVEPEPLAEPAPPPNPAAAEFGIATGPVNPQALIAPAPKRARRRPETSLRVELLQDARTKSRWVPWLVAGGGLAVVVGGIAAIILARSSASSDHGSASASAAPSVTVAEVATAAPATSVAQTSVPAETAAPTATAAAPSSAVAETPSSEPEPTATAAEPVAVAGKPKGTTKPTRPSGAGGKTGTSGSKARAKGEDDLFSRK